MADRLDPKGRKLRNGETYDAKTGRYRYSYFDSKGKRCQIYSWTLTKNDIVPAGKNQMSKGESLREKEQMVQLDIANDIDSSKGNMTVYELMKRYVNLKWKEVRETTRNGYRTQLKFMEKNPFGRRKIKTIDPTEAEEWIQELHDKYGKNYSTLHTLRGILRPAFAMAKKSKWITDNPFDFSLNKKRYGGTRTRDAISKSDMKRFLDFARTDKHFSKYFYGFYILFNTGLRISEFCGLTEDDIDFEKHQINVERQLIRIHDGDKLLYFIEEPKTKFGVRKIPMFSDVETAFKEVIKNRPKVKNEQVVWNQDHTKCASGFLWLDKNNQIEVAQHWQNHLRWAVNKYNRLFKEEIKDLSPHVCRHTFCTNCAAGGMSPKTLQLIMGHSSIQISLDIYVHLEEKDVQHEFFNMVKNRNYDFSPRDRVREFVAPDDDEGELSEPDDEELPDDDDDVEDGFENIG